MIIANPIYDVVFKKMMENERIAKFFIGTLLNKTIESITLKPQEFTYQDKLTALAVFRLDFIAVIKEQDGTNRKILIEIQKAQNHFDLMRFRNYLAEQYKKEDTTNDEEGHQPLSITTIYILGYPLKEIKTACVHVERQYKDLINNAILTEKNDFIEKLTHDSYIIQVKRITGRYQSSLDKLLSIFEQNHFVYDNTIIKEYLHKVDEKHIEEIVQMLHYSGTDPKTKAEIETEQEAWRTVNAMLGDTKKKMEKMEEKIGEMKEKMGETKEKLGEAEEKLGEAEEKLGEAEQEIVQKNKTLENQQMELEAQKKLIEELKRKLDSDK